MQTLPQADFAAQAKEFDKMPVRIKKCKWCDDPEPKHWPFQCFENPERSKMKNRGMPGRVKRLAARGKVSNLMQEVRRAWFIDNPPDDKGYYYCYIPGCGKALLPIEVELDHIKSRGRHPELRFESSNLAPACHGCNSAKGSLSLEEYLKKRDV